MAIIRVNFNTFNAGEDFLNRLEREASRNLQVFFRLLSSYWRSTIDGPNYARELKALASELSMIRLLLEDSRTDAYYSQTRSEYLYQVLTSVMFPKRTGAPNPQLPDLAFRDFLIQILDSYFRGSIPTSLQDAINLFVNGKAKIIENFLEARKPASGYDISDQFTFDVDVLLDSPGEIDSFMADKNIRLILNILRPAHTLYRLKYILQDEWFGQLDPDQGINSKITDKDTLNIFKYDYEDFRRYCDGIDGIDRLGVKIPIQITDEDHSDSF